MPVSAKGYNFCTGEFNVDILSLCHRRLGDLSLGFGLVIVSCSWARHFTLMVLVSTQEYNLVVVNFQVLEGLPEMDLWLSWLLVLVLTPGIFLQLIQFSSLYKNQHSKFQFYLVVVDEKSHLVECPLLNFILFITIQ